MFTARDGYRHKSTNSRQWFGRVFFPLLVLFELFVSSLLISRGGSTKTPHPNRLLDNLLAKVVDRILHTLNWAVRFQIPRKFNL